MSILAPILIIGLGVAGAHRLYTTKPAPPRVEREAPAKLVQTLTTVLTNERIQIEGMGVVKPAKLLVVQPQVSGAIDEHHDNMLPGGLIEQGELLVHIDDRDYRLALAQTKATAKKAQLELRVAQGRKAIAEREWELMAEELGVDDDVDSDLARHEPQLEAAEAALLGVLDAIDSAALNLERTDILAPFNAMVREESVEVGQVVRPGMPLATLIGTDVFWVEVALSIDQLARVQIPGHNSDEGSVATAFQAPTSGSVVERSGRIVRLLRDLDPVGRMARVVVAVEDPMDLQAEPSERRLPLLIGAYVKVRLAGDDLGAVVKLPVEVMRGDNVVWIVTEENTLEFREVKTVWRDRSTVFIGEGLIAGERIVTSAVPAAVPGMALRVAEPLKPKTPDAGAGRDGDEDVSDVGEPDEDGDAGDDEEGDDEEGDDEDDDGQPTPDDGDSE